MWSFVSDWAGGVLLLTLAGSYKSSGGCFNIVFHGIIRHQGPEGGHKVPVAVAVDELHREELKSLEGAYVVIREMTYGERLSRSGLMGAMKVLKDNKSDYAGELSMQTEKMTLWDFGHLIVEHNLEDADGRTLNFKNEADIKKLGARVGDEVGTLIDKWNSFEDEGN